MGGVLLADVAETAFAGRAHFEIRRGKTITLGLRPASPSQIIVEPLAYLMTRAISGCGLDAIMPASRGTAA
ncbi:hypothetical protein AOQ71_26040 [Bradyrhizobium manausense]|uniref:Uncharacterized protein n=1 Tax=Bradyrhizobium manausense TaxID=989370 RepID=A0A0R3DGC9_9BRAD|nr:hypothetical protein AOQ71_26040 [Bradyrhizobium manausense]